MMTTAGAIRQLHDTNMLLLAALVQDKHITNLHQFRNNHATAVALPRKTSKKRRIQDMGYGNGIKGSTCR